MDVIETFTTRCKLHPNPLMLARPLTMYIIPYRMQRAHPDEYSFTPQTWVIPAEYPFYKQTAPCFSQKTLPALLVASFPGTPYLYGWATCVIGSLLILIPSTGSPKKKSMLVNYLNGICSKNDRVRSGGGGGGG